MLKLNRDSGFSRMRIATIVPAQNPLILHFLQRAGLFLRRMKSKWSGLSLARRQMCAQWGRRSYLTVNDELWVRDFTN